VLNGGDEITALEREDAERAFIRFFLPIPEQLRPQRFNELVKVSSFLALGLPELLYSYLFLIILCHFFLYIPVPQAVPVIQAQWTPFKLYILSSLVSIPLGKKVLIFNVDTAYIFCPFKFYNFSVLVQLTARRNMAVLPHNNRALVQMPRCQKG
jgi:hypothetical protein